MSARIIAAASLWLAVAASASSRIVAQTAGPAGRVVSLSDTLGANFPLADSATKTGSLADYDSLVGTWTFRFQTRRPDGSFNEPILGHWTFDKKPGGGLIEDRFRPDDPSVSMGVSLYSYRIYDPERRLWQIIGASSNGGAVQLGLTWSDAGNRYVIQRAGRILVRMRYSAIVSNHFVWRSDRSYDNGTTWIRDFAVLEATRVGR
jgi:hypothetical protein